MPEPVIRVRVRRRAVLARTAAVVLALISAAVIARDLHTLERRTARLGPLVPALSAARDLPLGRVLRAGDLRTALRHRSQLAPGIVTSVADAVGRTLVVPLLAGTPLPAAALAPARRTGTAALVSPGMRALRVVADGALVPPVGATVSVLAPAGGDPAALGVDPSGAGGGVGPAPLAPAQEVATAARVLAVEAPRTERDDVRRAVAVTLLVTPDEARRLASAGAAGPLILTLEPPEDACCPPTPE